MTPEERQLISGLFDRMRQQGAGMKDRDAEAFIQDAIRRMPDTPYMLVQTTLVQEMALQQSESRIQELEQQVRDLEARTTQPQQSSGSFLGGLFGGAAARPASVPSAGYGAAPRGSAPAPSAAPRQGPWGNTAGNTGGFPAQQGGYGQPMPQQMPMQQAGGGGGFMRSAMTTAAGVAGGMLAANAISNMLGGHSAQAAGAGLTGAQTAATGHHDDAVDHANTQASNDDNDPGNVDDNDPGYDDAGGGDAGGGWDE